jgi:hypothetical protein
VESEPLTPAQQEYLACFDELLASKTVGSGARARRRMGVMLNYVLAEAGLDCAIDTRWRDDLLDTDHRIP